MPASPSFFFFFTSIKKLVIKGNTSHRKQPFSKFRLALCKRPHQHIISPNPLGAPKEELSYIVDNVRVILNPQPADSEMPFPFRRGLSPGFILACCDPTPEHSTGLVRRVKTPLQAVKATAVKSGLSLDVVACTVQCPNGKWCQSLKENDSMMGESDQDREKDSEADIKTKTENE